VKVKWKKQGQLRSVLFPDKNTPMIADVGRKDHSAPDTHRVSLHQKGTEAR